MTPEQKAEYNAKRNKDISEHLARQRANMQALRDKNASTGRVIPKDHPLSPQIADKTVLPKNKPLYPINHG